MSLVIFEQHGPIGKLILNNPKELNAMTPEMGEAIAQAVLQVNAARDLRVVLVTGAGRAFSAGGNLQFILEHTGKSLEENKEGMIEFYSRFLTLREIEPPTIAVVNGPAIGAGFMVALACDLRYASADAKLAANFAKIGLSSGMGGLYWLVRLAGPSRAAELLFTGRTFSAKEGHRLGLINGVFPPEQLEAKAIEVAQAIAQNAPVALKVMKKGIQKATTAHLEELLDYESSGQAQTFLTEDLKEGVRAVQAKREPKFQGK